MEREVGGDIHLKLNIGERPIANKYREGKMKSTLERELNSMWNRWKQANQCAWTRACFRELVLACALFAVRRRCCQFLPVGRGFGVLTRSDPTRLETRTKESNMCASTRVTNPCAQVTRIALALAGASRVVKLCFPHKSMYVGTRKMVNYACAERSRGKPWWKLEAILTCKSFVWHEYRGERLIEPSSSWFPPKFPSG